MPLLSIKTRMPSATVAIMAPRQSMNVILWVNCEMRERAVMPIEIKKEGIKLFPVGIVMFSMISLYISKTASTVSFNTSSNLIVSHPFH